VQTPLGALPRRRRHWLPALSVLLAILLTIASIGAVYINLDRMRESLAWVKHTDEVLLQASEMDGDVVEAESAERGYLLTGDDDFRTTFLDLRDHLPQQQAKLFNLVSDNPQQRRYCSEFSRSWLPASGNSIKLCNSAQRKWMRHCSS
jgi:CHASE3 domain sensor protein